MIFSSLTYLVFFGVILALMIIIPSARVKKALLLGASYVFYAWWDYRFTALMAFVTASNYALGRLIEGTEDERRRSHWLWASVVLNLCVLGFFKYYNFFIDAANRLLAGLGTSFPLLEIVLPVGISFIIFEVMSYTIDIYRRTNGSARSVWDLALLVAFFPHLIAGPILKPREFLPQLAEPIVIRWRNLEAGIQIFLTGLVKKVLIADNLAPFVDAVYVAPQDYASTTVWLAVLAYAVQIFCDFSGYTDMAIGSARCLGFRIPQNFNLPYLSRSITEFWRRWHISLSTWLRDYLYISLGGNRKGPVRQYVNLFLTMLLGGLWHGASWNFVLWGGLHGSALAVHKLYVGRLKRPEWEALPLYQVAAWGLTFTFVSLAWVCFRSADFGITLQVFSKLAWQDPGGIRWVPTVLLAAAVIMPLAHYVGRTKDELSYLKLDTFPGLFALFFTILLVLGYMPTRSSPFIYFQF